MDSYICKRGLGVIVGYKRTMSQQWEAAEDKATVIVGCNNRSIASESKEVNLPLCFALVRVHLE